MNVNNPCICSRTLILQASKKDVQQEFRKQVDVFVKEGLDFLLCEVNNVTFMTFGYFKLGIKRSIIFLPHKCISFQFAI